MSGTVAGGALVEVVVTPEGSTRAAVARGGEVVRSSALPAANHPPPAAAPRPTATPMDAQRPRPLRSPSRPVVAPRSIHECLMSWRAPNKGTIWCAPAFLSTWLTVRTGESQTDRGRGGDED